MTLKELKQQAIARAFLQFGVPGFYWWLFILYCAVYGMNPDYHGGAAQDLLEPLMNLGALAELGDALFLVIIAALIFIYVLIFLLAIYGAIVAITVIVSTPVQLFEYGFHFDNWMLFGASIAAIWTVCSAFTFRFGEFKEDTTYISGHHYDVSMNWDDTIKVEKVNEYSDDGSFLFNILLLILRIIILVSMGPILFGIRCFMISKIKCTEEWETREMK